MKRERDEWRAGGDSESAGALSIARDTGSRKAPRVQDAYIPASPVSPTVAAGVFPRSSSYAPRSPHPPAAAATIAAAPLPVSTSAAVVDMTADPAKALEAIKHRLALTSEPHLQANLLLQFSHIAISPGAQTNAAIDFLFSFLQQSQSGASHWSAVRVE